MVGISAGRGQLLGVADGDRNICRRDRQRRQSTRRSA
jgi:hypothetical protein